MFTVNQFKDLISESQNTDVVKFSVEVVTHQCTDKTMQIVSNIEFLGLTQAVKYAESYINSNPTRLCNIYYNYIDEECKTVKSQLMSVHYSNDCRFRGITYSYKNETLCKLILKKEEQ